MTKNELFHLLGISDLTALPARVMEILTGEETVRNQIYLELLKLNNHDLSHDWFQPLYESELAERKQKKQDFTPPELSIICSRLTSQEGSIHEPTAGNGSMIIADWWERQRKRLPWDSYPSQNLVTCWELSERSIPLLLLNLSIRGIMGYVYHGDVLENRVIQKYILLNKTDDNLGFSDVIKANINDRIVNDDIR